MDACTVGFFGYLFYNPYYFSGTLVNALLYQVPGGMLSNLISQLKQANAEDKYYEVLEEVPRVRKDFGYPRRGKNWLIEWKTRNSL